MSSQFECPRCQTTFAGDDGASFEDCPECGSLALPVGDGGPAPAIHKAPTPEQLAHLAGGGALDSLPDGAPAALSQEDGPLLGTMLSDEQEPLSTGGSGIFNALMEDTSQDMNLPAAEVASSASGGELGSMPNTLLGGEIGALADVESDAVPSPFSDEGAAVPPPTGAPADVDMSVTRSEQWDGLSFDAPPPGQSSGDVFSEPTVNQGLSQEWAPATEAQANPAHLDDGDLPVGGFTVEAGHPSAGAATDMATMPAGAPAAMDLPSLPSMPTAHEEAAPASTGLDDSDYDDSALSDPSHMPASTTGEGGSEPTSGDYADDDDAFGGDDAFFSQEASMEGGALAGMASQDGGVMLGDLESREGDFRLDGSDASDLFSGASFDALEAAFDEAAGSEEGQPTAEAALLQSSQGAFGDEGHFGFGEVADEGLSGMELGVPGAPRLRQPGDALHLTLRDETLAQATLPRDQDADDVRDDDNDDDVDEFGLRSLQVADDDLKGLRGTAGEATERLPGRKGRASAKVVTDDDVKAGADDDDTEVQEADDYDLTQVPSPFSVLSVARVVLLLMVGTIVGVGVGVISAPKEKKKPTSARMRAELKLADGNRAYADGKYDDALGHFRGAISTDRQFALAYRAKAAVLVKEKRFDDAAKAYKKYLKIAGDPADREQVEEILARYLGPNWKSKP